MAGESGQLISQDAGMPRGSPSLVTLIDLLGDHQELLKSTASC